MNGNGALKRQQTPAPQPEQRGIFVPREYLPETSDRSLQINIDSADDAKSVIQNLPAIKAAYDAAGMTSVEFCIAEQVVKEVESTLLGAINWCKTYRKHVSPNPGNVLFPLPSYKDLSIPTQLSSNSTSSMTRPESNQGARIETQAPVKPQRPVRAEPARQ